MMENVTRWRHRAVHRAVMALSTRPALYYGARAITGSMDHQCIHRNTELVIEGYPRSANSTTVHGFLERQERSVRVAHHKHHAAQLIRAAQWGIPAIALIRKPHETILSNLALAEEGRRRTGRMGRGNALTFDDAAKGWLTFYQAILPHGDKFVVAPFERVTCDLEGVIDDVNKRFGTSFRSSPAVLTPQHELGWHALPNPVRREVKVDLEEVFQRMLSMRPRLAALIDRCDALYGRLIRLE